MFTTNRPSGTIYDRLKHKYGNYQQDWQLFFKNKNGDDFEYIHYIVNFIIEQAKHSIVISELPDVIRTLHCEAETILRKNRMITLQEAIAQVQRIGAMKYPYLRKVKPLSPDDFVKEVIREVFDRLGKVITLDMIENICRFTTCSTHQLLQAMPAIDVNEAATLIVEDISRNQRDDHKLTDALKKSSSLSVSTIANRKMDSKLENRSIVTNKGRTKSKRALFRSLSNLKQSLSKTKLSKYKDLFKIRKRSQSPSISSHIHQSPKSTNFTPTISKNSTTTNHSQESQKIDSNEKILSNIVHPSIPNHFPISNNQKLKSSQSKSNTQTYSIHSEEGLSRSTHAVPSMETISIEGTYDTNLKASKSSSTTRQSIRHYTKYCYQHSDISDNEEQTTDENCPLEDLLNNRLRTSK